MAWIIVNKTDDRLAWSNDDGWTESTFETFDDIERETLNLPIDGKWERVPWNKLDS